MFALRTKRIILIPMIISPCGCLQDKNRIAIITRIFLPCACLEYEKDYTDNIIRIFYTDK